MGVYETGDRQRNHHPQGLLIEALIRMWHHSPNLQNNAKLWIKSMPRHLEDVVAAEGGHDKILRFNLNFYIININIFIEKKNRYA